MVTIEHTHITHRADGTPMIAGTTCKVLHIVLEHVGWGWDAATIHRSHPDIELGKIHAALAYYYDNRSQMDEAIARQQADVEAIFNQLGIAPGQARLAALRASRR